MVNTDQLAPTAPWEYEDCERYFSTGSTVVDRYRSDQGKVKGLDRSAHGGTLVIVNWDSTGISALVHPSQIILSDLAKSDLNKG